MKIYEFNVTEKTKQKTKQEIFLKITANNQNESVAIQWNILNQEFYNTLPERKATILKPDCLTNQKMNL